MVYSIGHSNLDSEVVLAELHVCDVAQLIDVRAFPGSRRHPQFGREALEAGCTAQGLRYRWRPALGGRRRSAIGDASPHVAWRIPAFRAYADYMDTPEFAAAFAELEALAAGAPTAIMCAESLWWRCHRRLICDRLLIGGWRVVHLAPSRPPAEHVLPDFARVAGDRLVYDGGTTPRLPGC